MILEFWLFTSRPSVLPSLLEKCQEEKKSKKKGPRRRMTWRIRGQMNNTLRVRTWLGRGVLVLSISHPGTSQTVGPGSSHCPSLSADYRSCPVRVSMGSSQYWKPTHRKETSISCYYKGSQVPIIWRLFQSNSPIVYNAIPTLPVSIITINIFICFVLPSRVCEGEYICVNNRLSVDVGKAFCDFSSLGEWN